MSCNHVLEKITTELGVYLACRHCGQKFVTKKRQAANLWIAQRYYQSRGTVYTGQLSAFINAFQAGGIILLLINAVWGNMPPLWIIPLLWFGKTAIETLLGIKDYKRWKVAQTEGLFGFQYSPLAVENLRRLKNIERVVNPSEYKPESVVDIIQSNGPGWVTKVEDGNTA